MSRKRIQRKNPWQPTPAPDILQTRPFSNGKKARESRLPQTDILQTRPFSPRNKDVSTPKDTRSFEEKMQGAEFRYNGVSIPTVQREEDVEENSQEQGEVGTSAANISVFAPSTQLENSIVSPFSLRQTGGWGQEETIQREEEVEEQREVGIQKQQLEAPPDDGTIQRLCAECEGELTDKEEKEPIQAKLTVGEADDKYEQEADAVAAQVVEKINAPQTQQSVQRQSELGAVSDLNITVMRHSEGAAGGSDVTQDVEQGIQQARGGGQGLDESVREPMEGAFGADFSGVKVHTDAQSDQLNRSIQAKAFTTGQDIFFKQGEYQPGSKGGQELLAHELTHVVQQAKEIRRYRNKNKEAFNYGTREFNDKRLHDPSLLTEDSFNAKKDKETKPWIKQITVEFDSLKTDSDGNTYSSGTASVQYYDNPVKLPDFSFTISGGSQTLGKTDSGTFTVSRIEGIGYNSGSASGQAGVDFDPANREGPLNRYSKDLAGNMSYAVFYNKGEALHAGPLDFSSHGCVHVDWTDYSTIRQMNYHSVIGLTKVTVKYLSAEAKEARRVKQLNEDYEKAIKSSDWEKAALLLNGFNDADILERVKRLNSDQLSQLRKGALKSMPGWSKRVTDSIDSVATP